MIEDIVAVTGSLLITGFIFGAWAWIFFKLLDTDKWYFQLLGVLITGIVFSVIFLGLRWVYRSVRKAIASL